MTPSQLLARIEALGIEARYVDKIRKQIEDPAKVVKNKAIVKYLLSKNLVTKAQAKELLAPPTEDEIVEVKQPAQDFDSSALIDAEEFQPKTTKKPEPEAIAEPIAEVIVEPIEVEPEPIDVDATMVQDYVPDPIAEVGVEEQFGGFDDPLGGGAIEEVEAFDDTAAPKTEKEYAAIEAFKGKRDQSDQFKTKWLYIGPALMFLLAVGIWVLSLIIGGKNADEMIKAANEAYERPNFPDAIVKIDAFIKEFPTHEEVPKFRARRVNSIVRTKFESGSYEEMIQQADLLLPPLAEEEDSRLDLIRTDLSATLPRGLFEIVDKVSDRMLSSEDNDVESMEKELATVVGYRKVIDNQVYISNTDRKKRVVADYLSGIKNKVLLIEGLIKKEKDYKKGLVDIEELRTQGETDKAFADYRALTRRHPDLASRKPLAELMLSISKRESELVKPIEVELTPKASWRPSTVSQSVVLSATSGNPVASLEAEVIPVVVDGAAYGFDAGNGSLVWRHFVGQQTTMSPVNLDETHTLIVNEMDNDLLCVNTQTGDLVWRQEFGEAIRSPAIGPSSKFIVVSTDSGKILQLDAATGVIQKATQLPPGQAPGPSALVNTRDPIVYQVGEKRNLYVLDQQDYSCKEVYWLGHYKDSVAVPPIQWAGYILVAVNGGESCDLHVFKPQKNGTDLVRVQVIQSALGAPMTLPFIKAGNAQLMAGENGQITLLSIDPTNDFEPISYDSQLVGDADGPKPLVSAASSNVWVAGNGIVHARVRRNRGTVERVNTNQTGDQFLMAAQKLDDYVFHVRRRKDSGMLTAALANAKDLEIVWRTDFAGEIAGDLAVINDVPTAVSSKGDVFQLDDSTISSGKALPKATSSLIQNLEFHDVVQFDNSLVAVGPIGSQAIIKPARGDKKATFREADMMFYDGENLKLTKLAPPANLPACHPLKFDTDLIIASSSGYVARINPQSNRMVGTPFQTAITPDSVINWLPPISIGSDRLAIAMGESAGEPNKLFVLSVADENRISPLLEFESELPFKGELNLLGDSLLGVLGGRKVDSLATFGGDPLAQQNVVELEGAVVAGPWMVDDNLLVKLDNDKLYMFGSDLALKWSQDSPNVQFATAPEMVDGKLMLCVKSGKVDFVNPETGEREFGFDLNRPVVNRPLTIGSQMFFSGADGTVYVVDQAQQSN